MSLLRKIANSNGNPGRTIQALRLLNGQLRRELRNQSEEHKPMKANKKPANSQGVKATVLMVFMSVLFASLLVSFAKPAKADGPTTEESIWEEHIGRGDPYHINKFSAPADASGVKVSLEWAWGGHPNQEQLNEMHAARLPTGQVIDCPDFGDEELEGQWLSCGSTSFPWAEPEELTVEVEFTGDNSSTGSHYFRVIVAWDVEPPAATLATEVDCSGATFSGYAEESMQLVYQLSDGQSRVVEVAGNFEEFVSWSPKIEGQYGPHSVSASAQLVYEGQELERAEASDTLICGDPITDLMVGVDCSGATFSGYAEEPMQLVYQLSDGQSRVVEVAGNFEEFVSWSPEIEGQYGPHSVSASAQLVYEDQELERAEASDTLICGGPITDLMVEVDCKGATFSGYAEKPMLLSYQLSDTQNGEKEVVGNFEEYVAWSPKIEGQYGPHSVSASAQLVFEGQELERAEASDTLTCGNPITSLTVEIDCNGATFSGYAEVQMSLNYKLSDGQTDKNLPVKDTFTLTVPWQPEIDGKYGPHRVKAQGWLSYRGKRIPAIIQEKSGQLTCGQAVQCTLSPNGKPGSGPYSPQAIDQTGDIVEIDAWQAESNFDLNYNYVRSDHLPVAVIFPETPGKYWVQFSVAVDNIWLAGETCRIETEVPEKPCDCGQYQDFIGAVPFGSHTPELEPGKEYFDGTRSIMVNVEYLDQGGQGEIVYRFNGQEISKISTSLFNGGTYRQVESADGRAVTPFDEGVTKLISYRYGAEQGRFFQTFSQAGSRWIRPLDQPFEHKYQFALELHGPANLTDTLVYAGQTYPVRYDATGLYTIELTYQRAGLVAIYPPDMKPIVVDEIVYPIAQAKRVSYTFEETGLQYYQIVDHTGQVVAQDANSLSFEAQPGAVYRAQLVYPATSLFVGLYDDMKVDHPQFWTMAVDAGAEHDHEFHVDYHRDEDGNVVIENLYLLNATTSVAQQFPYGRHDGALPGVTIVGIPDVSMVAFCQRPGYHEVAYWGGWENESYYLPQRSWIFDEGLAKEWRAAQGRDCIDAAYRINQELARQGLRTDHTYRHHGQSSQGYQMIGQNIWSPYNLVGMRPPHIGKIFKPGTVLTYHHLPEETLFWAWDLEKGGLKDGIGRAELGQYVDALGPVEYVDQTGIHPPHRFR